MFREVLCSRIAANFRWQGELLPILRGSRTLTKLEVSEDRLGPLSLLTVFDSSNRL
jgi:hypothetical protein